MFSGLMLFGAAVGQVISAGDGSALVRPAHAVAVGDMLTVRRLEPTPGAPGRLPLFQWSKAGKARVTGIRTDGTAEVALVGGRAAAGDRIEQ